MPIDVTLTGANSVPGAVMHGIADDCHPRFEAADGSLLQQLSPGARTASAGTMLKPSFGSTDERKCSAGGAVS